MILRALNWMITALSITDRQCLNDTDIVDILLYKGNYSKAKIPGGGPVKVTVEIWVQEISAVSDITQDFHLGIYVSEQWLDPGMQFHHLNPCKRNISLGFDHLKSIWIPSLCFINSKTAAIQHSPFPNVWVLVYQNGTVWTNYRLNISGL